MAIQDCWKDSFIGSPTLVSGSLAMNLNEVELPAINTEFMQWFSHSPRGRIHRMAGAQEPKLWLR